MKIIFLNCWYLEIEKELLDFLISEKEEDTIYCFSEIDRSIVDKIGRVLDNYKYILDTNKTFDDLGHKYGQAIFIPIQMNVVKQSRLYTFKNIKNDVGFEQLILLEHKNKKFWISNVHGKAYPGHKLDTPARLKQSKIIIDSLKDKNESRIIGGDFNLLPDIKSVKMFEENGYRNLIQEFNIKDTRGKIHANKYEGQEIQRFADYCFISKDVKVKNFTVPDIEISDHLPLILEFDI